MIAHTPAVEAFAFILKKKFTVGGSSISRIQPLNPYGYYLDPDSSPVAFKYKSGRAARSGRVEAHGKGERRKFSDWQITVTFLAKKCFSCKLIFYASSLDFLTLVYINRSFYDVVSAKCVFLSSISAFNRRFPF